MKTIIINGSPRSNGNTAVALREMERVFVAEEIETETIHVGHLPIRGCIGCRKCKKDGRCAFDDIVNEAAQKFRECDGMVVGTPVYYAGANSTLTAFLTRLFYSTNFDKRMKVGVCVTAARRSGSTATFDEINKFFAISGMPVASGQYWNGVHGSVPGEALQDKEGMQMMRSLAKSMTFLMKSIELGKETYGLPVPEERIRTNFIR